MIKKDFLNKTPIRHFYHFQSIFNQLRIDKSGENKVVNLIQRRFLYCKKHAFYYWLLLITLLISSSVFAAPQVPHLRLVVGGYECLTNDACENGYCDIDDHVCKICPVCPVCPTLPECAAGQHQVDGVCVECISNAECTDSSKPRCDLGSFTCQACPAGKPFWNGSECESCPTGTVQSGDSCVCPSDKPHRLAACIACEGNKIFVSERNACECPSDLPNWNSDTKMCVASCQAERIWNATDNICQCAAETYWDSESETCVRCLGTSFNEKCYICDTEIGEKFDTDLQLCTIHYTHSWWAGRGANHTVLNLTTPSKYDYTVVVYATYVDDRFYMQYGPVENPSQQRDFLLDWLRSPTTKTTFLPQGYVAHFYTWNAGKNETGFTGWISLRRSPRILEH